MSFLVDPPLLFAAGAAIESAIDDETTAEKAERATLAIFIGTSVGLYLNRPSTRWLWRLCRARSGRDWMLNSGVFSIDADAAGLPTHVLAALAFCTYPLWIRAGRVWMRERRRRLVEDLDAV